MTIVWYRNNPIWKLAISECSFYKMEISTTACSTVLNNEAKLRMYDMQFNFSIVKYNLFGNSNVIHVLLICINDIPTDFDYR
jgi:hypothetical protein